MAHILTTVSLANGRRTEPVGGAELVGSVTAPEGTIVGLARVVAGVYGDDLLTRDVTNWFNPSEKKCEVTLSADKSTASGSFVEADNTRRCNFVYTDGVATRAKAIGASGRPVRYGASITASNDTDGGGCFAGIAFDGIVAEETNPPGFVNVAGTVGAKFNISLVGLKSSLTNAGHNGRLVYRTNGTGTCTIESDNSTFWFFPLQ